MRAVKNAVTLLAILYFANAASQVFIFELPEMIVKMNTTYLSKNHSTRLRCQIFDNVANLSFREVYWFKDSLSVSELPTKKGGAELQVDGNDLLILRGSHHTEGEYQCATIIEDIPLTENTTINTRLISAPVRLRKARITRFETFRSQTVRVRQGQVARMPCLGMPDVVPGPPDVWMEKEGHEGVPLGMTSNLRFVSTPNGLQIAIAQPQDAGKYFCVVRNTHTNQTRKSPLPIVLTVDNKQNYTREKAMKPLIVHPVLADYGRPVVVNAVAGQKVVLECVIWHSRVVWSTADYSLAPVSLTDETARVRQIWGNLRFKNVELNDSGLYECHGLDRYDEQMTLQEPTHPRVRFLLKVYAPTNVNLMVTPLLYSKYLQMSCFVNNSGYEIPMVYVNGDPLIDAMEKMGIPPQPNFFSNPVNVTLASNKPLTGSVQCISKPAMNEAEVYGDGLERGRSMNLYVTDRSSSIEKMIEQGPTNITKTVGSDAQLTCIPASSDIKTYWKLNNQRLDVLKNPKMAIVGSATLMIANVGSEDQGWYTCVGTDSARKSYSQVSAFLEVINITVPITANKAFPLSLDLLATKNFEEPLGPLIIYKPRGFVASGQNVRLQWGLPSNHPQLRNLVNFDVELRKGNAEQNWIRSDIEVQAHVRAVTVRNLIPNNRYQFRIIGNLSNKTKVYSSPTEWMEINQKQGILPQPIILKLQGISDTSIQITWEYSTGMQITDEDKFHVNYQSINSTLDDRDSFIVSGANHAIIEDLEPETTYAVSVYAENNNAQSPISKIRFAKTLEEKWLTNPEIEKDERDKTTWQFFRENYLFPPNQSVTRFVAVVILSAVVVVFLICTSCVFLWWLCSKSKKHCIDDKDYERQKRIRFCIDEKTAQATLGLTSHEPNETIPLKFDVKEDNESFPLYSNRSPDLGYYANTTTGNHLEMKTTPTRRPRIASNDFRFDDVNPSRISLDTVVGMRTEAPSTFGYSTLKNNNDIHSYVNVGSEANLYSTIRRGGGNFPRRQTSNPPCSPSLRRKPPTNNETSSFFENTNQAYSPESSTISPTSHTSLHGHSGDSAREYRNIPPPTMSTFLPAQSAATLHGSYLALDRRRMNDSMIETSSQHNNNNNPLPEAV